MKMERTLQETRSLFEAFKTKSAEDRKAAVDSAIQKLRKEHEADMSDKLTKQRKEAELKAKNNETFIETNDVAFLMLKKKRNELGAMLGHLKYRQLDKPILEKAVGDLKAEINNLISTLVEFT